jgi:hypothetical protein
VSCSVEKASIASITADPKVTKDGDRRIQLCMSPTRRRRIGDATLSQRYRFHSSFVIVVERSKAVEPPNSYENAMDAPIYNPWLLAAILLIHHHGNETNPFTNRSGMLKTYHLASGLVRRGYDHDVCLCTGWCMRQYDVRTSLEPKTCWA